MKPIERFTRVLYQALLEANMIAKRDNQGQFSNTQGTRSGQGPTFSAIGAASPAGRVMVARAQLARIAVMRAGGTRDQARKAAGKTFSAK